MRIHKQQLLILQTTQELQEQMEALKMQPIHLLPIVGRLLMVLPICGLLEHSLSVLEQKEHTSERHRGIIITLQPPLMSLIFTRM